MEEIVGNIHRELAMSTSSIRLSNLPVQEIVGLQKELQKAAQGPHKTLPQHWVESGNLAAFNGLKHEPYLTVPVDLNLVFIGFGGDGHHRLNLQEDELRPWFEHMEHRMAHASVPLRQDDAADGPPAARRPAADGPAVYYKYRFHVLELHPDVGALVESVIWDNARPVDPWAESAISWTAQDMHQVDPGPVAGLLEDLTASLRLNASAFTLFLINPKLPHPDFNYGYRSGFSEAELNRLHQNETLLDILMDRSPTRPQLRLTPEQVEDVHTIHADLEQRAGRAGPAAAAAAAVAEQREALGKRVDGLSAEPAEEGGAKHVLRESAAARARGDKPAPRGRPKYTDMRDLSKVWAAMYKQALHDLSYWQRHPAEESADFDDDDGAAERAYIKEMKRRLGVAPDSGAALPPDMLFEVAATRMLQAKKSSHEGTYVRRAIEDKHSKEDCLVDTWIGDGRFAFIDFSAGPFEWGPIVGGKGVRTARTIPDIAALETAATDFTAGGRWKDPEYVQRVHRDLREHGLQKLEAEKALLLAFLSKNCDPSDAAAAAAAAGEGPAAGADAGSTCHQLRHKLSTVEAFMRTHTRIEAKDEATLAQLSFVTGGPHEGANVSLVQRAVFARLGALIESAQRQLVTPPVSAVPAPYRAQVYFHVYIVSNHDTYQPDAPEHFDYGQFKSALEALRLPRQQFHHVLHRYTMAEDPALAVAFANSLRSAAVATLKVDGRFVSTKRMYLDSQVLQRHLQLLHDRFVSSDAEDAASGDAGEGGAVHRRDVPVFIFSMDVPMPVFIDKHYQARALEDMVLAVQSDELEWESHLACNGRAVVWNLRNPLRAVLSATAQHLTGLLPSHVALDEARGRVSQDWLWSVGCGPLSHTSTLPSGGFPAASADAAHRAAVVGILREALAAANEGVATLARSTTSLDNRLLATAAPNDRLVQLHVAARLAWSKALAAAHRLDFDGAIPHAHTAARSARAFRDLAAHAEKLLLLSACLHPVHNAPFDFGMVLVVGAALLSVGSYYLFGSSKEKPKIN